jgi:hypothetical protein
MNRYYLARGYTVADLAKRFRVSEDKVRSWIRSRELVAVNTARRGHRPRFVVTVEALAVFERSRNAAPPEKVKRRKRTQTVDFYPDAV